MPTNVFESLEAAEAVIPPLTDHLYSVHRGETTWYVYARSTQEAQLHLAAWLGEKAKIVKTALHRVRGKLAKLTQEDLERVKQLIERSVHDGERNSG